MPNEALIPKSAVIAADKEAIDAVERVGKPFGASWALAHAAQMIDVIIRLIL